MRIQVPSFAKVNWILKILGKRPDGFHELKTVFQTVDLSDHLEFELVSEPTIDLRAEGREVPEDRSNLVFRAAELLRARRRPSAGVRMILRKRVPVGAGLGGGSANAAIALLALNRLWDCGLSLGQLEAAGCELGSDVPVFLTGGTVAAGGRGERLSPLPDMPQPVSLALLFPGFEISARDAYSCRDWGLRDESQVLTSAERDSTIQRFCRFAGSAESLSSVLENDFEGPLYQRYPDLRRAEKALKEAGCGKTLLSGSGSTVFGIGGEGATEGGIRAIRGQRIGEVFLCRTLSRREYWRRLAGAGLTQPAVRLAP